MLLVVSVESVVVVDSMEVVDTSDEVVVASLVVGSTGSVVSLGSPVLVSPDVDVLVLPVVVGASEVSPADEPSSPNMLAPESFAQPNGLSGPQLLLIPQPSDATGARSTRIRANMAG